MNMESSTRPLPARVWRGVTCLIAAVLVYVGGFLATYVAASRSIDFAHKDINDSAAFQLPNMTGPMLAMTACTAASGVIAVVGLVLVVAGMIDYAKARSAA